MEVTVIVAGGGLVLSGATFVIGHYKAKASIAKEVESQLEKHVKSSETICALRGEACERRFQSGEKKFEHITEILEKYGGDLSEIKTSVALIVQTVGANKDVSGR